MLKYNAKKYIKINNFKWFAVKLTKLYVYFPPNGIEKERDHCVVNKFESHNISFFLKSFRVSLVKLTARERDSNDATKGYKVHLQLKTKIIRNVTGTTKTFVDE